MVDVTLYGNATVPLFAQRELHAFAPQSAPPVARTSGSLVDLPADTIYPRTQRPAYSAMQNSPARRKSTSLRADSGASVLLVSSMFLLSQLERQTCGKKHSKTAEGARHSSMAR